MSVAPFISHSPESLRASVAIEGARDTLRRAVYKLIRDSGEQGATDDEMQVQLQMNPSTQRPRRIELWTAGLIRKDGRSRITRSGRSAAVWVALRDGEEITGRQEDLKREQAQQKTFDFQKGSEQP